MTDPATYRRAGELFDELIELEEAEREAALQRAAGSEPEAVALARKLIEADRAPRLPGVADVHPEEASPADPAGVLGASIGPYRIESLLGRGGMGAVYLGSREQPSARVAIKFISLVAAPAAALERFRLETEWLAALDHPGIVRYRSSGVDTRGRPYLVMDFIDGEPLSAASPDVRAGVDSTVDVVVQIARAVHHLHQRGILHGDLKPSNILLARRGDGRVPVVIDLGIARSLEADGPQVEPGSEGAPGGSTAAAAGDAAGIGVALESPAGTPRYMSPELWEGARRPDVRSDVYALGAVLFALLSGRAPEGDRDPSEAVDGEAFGAEAAARARRIAGDLDAIVRRARAADPDARYDSAAALAEDLGRWRRRLPVEARPGTLLHRTGLLARRRPLESALGMALLALVTVASVVVVRSLVREKAARRGYQQQVVATERSLARERAARESYEEQVLVNQETIDFFANDLFSEVQPGRQGPDTPVIEILRGASQKIVSHPGGRTTAVLVGVGRSLAELFDNLGFMQDAEGAIARTLLHARALPEDSLVRLHFEIMRGRVLARLGRVEAQEVLEGAWRRASELSSVGGADSEVTDALVAKAGGELGQMFEIRGDFAEAERWLTRSLEMLPEGSVDSVRLRILYELAVVQQRRGEHEAAIQHFETLLPTFEAREGTRSFAVMGVHANLARNYSSSSNPGPGLAHAEAALDIADEILEPDHEARLIALSNLVGVLYTLEEYEEAVDRGFELVDGCRARYGASSEELASQTLNLVETLFMAGRGGDEVAGELAAEALASFEALGEASYPVGLARACVLVARTAIERDAGEEEGTKGEEQGSRALLSRALALLKGLPDEGPLLAQAEAALAELEGTGRR